MARKSRERKQKKPRLASPHSVSLALSRARSILSRSKKLGTMTASDKGIAITPEDSRGKLPFEIELDDLKRKDDLKSKSDEA